LKEEALDRTMWRNRFGRGFGPVVRQINKRMNMVTDVALEPGTTIFMFQKVNDCSSWNMKVEKTL